MSFAEMVTSAGATRKARGWAAAEVDRYVGLEHLDSNNPNIRRWGSPESVGENSDLRHFEAGDVILARRGIEQRKVGVAEFRGVASGHALVFRARPHVVLPEFLPYFLLSDQFMNRALQFSAGSLSKTVNLSALMKQEFALPPLEEQRRIALRLTSCSKLVELLHEARLAAVRNKRSLLVDTFRPDRGTQDVFPSHWLVSDIRTAGDYQLGQQRHPMFDDGDNVRPYLRVANVLDGSIDYSDVLSMHFPTKSMQKFELASGDILLNEGQSTELVGRSAIYRGEMPGVCFQKTLLRFRCGPNLIPEFAHAFFQHMLYTGQFARVAVQTTSMAHLTGVKFAKLPIPVPPLQEQRNIVIRLTQMDAAVRALAERLSMANSVARGAINEMAPA